MDEQEVEVKSLFYALGMILAGAVLLVIVLPFEIVDEIKWRMRER